MGKREIKTTRREEEGEGYYFKQRGNGKPPRRVVEKEGCLVGDPHVRVRSPSHAFPESELP
jgi:hypothetical protein